MLIANMDRASIRRHQDVVNLDSNCIDILRCVCAFTVFSGHFLTHFNIDNEVLHEAAYFVRGVPVFFFLSGLFIARSLERYDTKEYLVRRATRIFPELWACVMLNLVPILISLGGAALIVSFTAILAIASHDLIAPRLTRILEKCLRKEWRLTRSCLGGGNIHEQ